MLTNPMCLEHSGTADYSEKQSEKRHRAALESLTRLADDLENASQRISIPDNHGIMTQIIGPDNYISEQIRQALKDLA